MRYTGILAVVFMLGSIFCASAQQTVTWSENKVQFTMPESGVSGNHNESVFEWKGSDYAVTLYYSKRGFELKDAYKATIAAARETGVKKAEREKEIKTASMEGVYFKGDKSGEEVLFAGLLNGKLKRGIFIEISYSGSFEDALKILDSFSISK